MLQLLHISIYVLYVGLFLRIIFRWKFFDIEGTKKTHLAIFFLLKVFAGLALTLIYTYYYTDQSKADIYRYFNDSKIISSVLFTNPVAWLKIMSGLGTYEPTAFKYLTDTEYFTHPATDFVTNNSLLIRVISILNYFSFYNIYVDTLLLNCITFVALVVLFKALKPYFVEFPQILYWPLFLMPSFVFWSSGLLKEGLLFVGISCYLSTELNFNEHGKWRRIIVVLFWLWVVAFTKLYVAAALLLSSILLPLRINDHRTKFLRAVGAGIFIVCALLIWQYNGGAFCQTVIDKHNEFVTLAINEHSNSILDTSILAPDCIQVAKLVPSALTNAVLRPFFWNGRNIFEILFAIENMIFIGFSLFALIFAFRLPKGQKLWLALFCFVFAILNYFVIGITVPIIGAIVHYRVVAAPFLLVGVLLITDLEKIKRFLMRLFSHLSF